MKKFLLLSFLILLFMTGCNTKEQIQIDTDAYIYDSDSSISEGAVVILKGLHDKKSNNFQGSISINDIEYPNVLFTSGSGFIAYEENKRTYLGEIYFNYETHQYTIEVSDKKLFHSLTKQEYQNDKLIISSPATNIEEARQINTLLKK
ncbi:hypothetical protein [Paenibacillus jiagnxiensis]|uniref:hypothetical protein n=1 Tax=Paenibacillus jiagnxiensis TaxID=3228926 RepID=UPI0033BC8734